MKLIEGLNWRYATKKFDTTKKVSQENLDKIKEAIRLSASSYGLQLYKVLIIENPELRAKLQPVSWGQTQIVDASHLLVLCSYTECTHKMMDTFVQKIADVRNFPVENVKEYGNFMKAKIGEFPEETVDAWMARQVYIALGNLLAACGELEIDSCPMEGFDAAQYDEILGLKEKGLTATVVATIGYRSAEDITQNFKKVRRPSEEMFEVI